MAQNIQIDKFARSQIIAIAQQFSPQKQITDIKPFGSGNINDTFLVSLQESADQSFILQRINTNVFHEPKLVMQNMRVYTNHVRDRLQDQPLERRWDIPNILQHSRGKTIGRLKVESFGDRLVLLPIHNPLMLWKIWNKREKLAML